MAFHHIQCPLCFTDYTISDEKYRESDGRMRCGTCREVFNAMVVTEQSSTPQFDPRDVFIEPLSSPLPAAEGGDSRAPGEPEASYVSYEKPVDPDAHHIELMSTHEFEYIPPEPKAPDVSDVPREIIEQYGNSDELSTTEILNNLRKRQRQNSDSDTTLEDDDKTKQLAFELTDSDVVSESKESLTSKQDQEIPEETPKQESKSKLPKAKAAPRKRAPVDAKPRLKIDDDFFLEPKRPRRRGGPRIGAVFAKLLVSIFLLALTIVLVYQIWLKQWIELPSNQPWFTQAQKTIKPYWDKAETQLTEWGIALPKRQNLSQLELISARTEPHPSQANTMLLKVSMINRADITQALPWLEMSLTDADGRLLARRNLSPKDYIYNNETQALIGPNELKKITIELLSFPKSATGYEIKLLSQ